MVFEKAELDSPKLLFRKEGDAKTVNGVRVGEKGRLETKEKLI